MDIISYSKAAKVEKDVNTLTNAVIDGVGIPLNALTWEHGGIASATGINNYDGSETRSRSPGYNLVSDYSDIKFVNKSGVNAFIIYYNSSKTYIGFEKIIDNQTYMVDRTETHYYFRIDLRAGFSAADNFYTYKIINQEISNNMHEAMHAQIYAGTGRDRWYFEESNATASVYFTTDSDSIMVRYGMNGVYKTRKTIGISDLATELGVSKVTSPKGKANCIAIATEKALVFDTQSETFKILDRSKLENFHIVILACSSGYLVNPSNYIMKAMIRNATANNNGNEFPLYFQSNLDSAIALYKKSAEAVGNHGDSFVFITDPHWTDNQKHSPNLIRYLIANSNLRNVICGGDVLGSGEKADELALGYDFVQRFDQVPGSIKCVTGNHDYNRNQHASDQSYWLTPDQGYSMFCAKAEMEIQDVHNGLVETVEDLDFYMDVPATNTRYLFASIAYGYVTTDTKNWIMSQLQDNPSLNFVIISHYLFGTSDYTSSVKTLFSAVKDFTNLKAWVYGHTHYDKVDYLSTGIPLICVDTDSSRLNQTYNQYTYTAGTITEQAFDVITVDHTSGDVECVRVGRGKHRRVNGGVNSVSASGTKTLTTDITSPEWSSSDETVATVSNGTVTGVAAGSAVIKAAGTDKEEYWYVVVS